MSPIEAAARSDCEFDMRGQWEHLGRVNRERYIARATLAHEAAVRAAYDRVVKAAHDSGMGHAVEQCVVAAVAAAIALDKPKEPT